MIRIHLINEGEVFHSGQSCDLLLILFRTMSRQLIDRESSALLILLRYHFPLTFVAHGSRGEPLRILFVDYVL